MVNRPPMETYHVNSNHSFNLSNRHSYYIPYSSLYPNHRPCYLHIGNDVMKVLSSIYSFVKNTILDIFWLPITYCKCLWEVWKYLWIGFSVPVIGSWLLAMLGSFIIAWNDTGRKYRDRYVSRNVMKYGVKLC